ncbi:helix-turn-helix transcriptional regulator [Streptomyces noursei]|uniref:helix-turn-helix transcriptional regulator n=1 Tax=Streptomyces noursei TaxID=1971 RepID=UPI0023B840CC|nr:helix-turn-helix domain-containing protein [Streptomyces noursei]
MAQARLSRYARSAARPGAGESSSGRFPSQALRTFCGAGCGHAPLAASPETSSPIVSDLVSGDGVATLRGFLTVRGSAEYLRLSPRTLYVWRHRRQGPPRFRMGPRGRVMYRLASLDEWIAE